MSLYHELKRRNVLRVATAYVVSAWLVIQVVDTIFTAFGYGEAAVRLVTILSAIGLVPVVVFTWAFQLTPEGLKRDQDVDDARTGSPNAGRRLDRIILVLLALALGYFAIDKFVWDPARDATLVQSAREEGRVEALVGAYGDRSLVVLPFENLSPDADTDYFSDGITEELLNLLAKVPGLRVISRSSAFSFKGQSLPIPEIAQRLQVGHVLEGSVRRAGNRVRITTKLIEARSDTHLWSDSWEHTLNDIFLVQQEIARRVTDQLEVSLDVREELEGAADTMGDENAEAYEQFLAGRIHTHKRGRQNLETALALLQRSIELDPDFAPAHAQMAIVTVLLKRGPATYGDLSLAEVRARAIPHIERALALNPRLPEAHGAASLLAYNSESYADGIAAGLRALELNPNYTDGMNWLYVNRFAAGEYKEAYEQLEKLLQVDPLSVVGRFNYATFLGHRGRPDAAHAMAESLVADNPVMGYRSHANIASEVEGDLAGSVGWLIRAQAAGAADSQVAGPLSWRMALLDLEQEALSFAGSDPYLVYLARADWEQAIDAAQARLERDPDNPQYRLELANALHLSGAIAAAQPIYEALLQHSGQRPLFDPFFFSPLPTARAAWGRRLAGNGAGAEALLELAREDNRQRARSGKHDVFYYRLAALIAAVEGRPEIALHNLQQAMESGLHDPLALREPAFESMRDQPAFRELEDELTRTMALEKQRFLRIACEDGAGSLPWRPLPATCTGLAQEVAHGMADG